MEFSLSDFVPVDGRDRVYTALAQPDAVNIGLVVGSTGALVIDTGSSAEQGRAIREAAQAVAGDVPLTHVVVTHAHRDHLFGLAAFADLETVAHRKLADLLAADAPPVEVPTPTRTFGLATTIDLGDCHAEVVHFGPGHTDHDAVVIVPARRVVFAGDLLESAQPPVVGEDTHPAQWPKTLDGTLGTLRSGDVVVPGHGELMSREDAFMQRAEIAWHNGKAEELYDSHKNPTGAWSEDGQWPWPQQPTEAFLAVAMARLAASGRPRKRQLPLLNR